MITTGCIIIKFVEHQALANGGGRWLYSCIDTDGSKTWHKLVQYYEDGNRPECKKVGQEYHVRITQSKRERYLDPQGDWQDKGEIFVIEESGWNHVPDEPAPAFMNDYATPIFGDIAMRLSNDAIYINDRQTAVLERATNDHGVYLSAILAKYYKRKIVNVIGEFDTLIVEVE